MDASRKRGHACISTSQQPAAASTDNIGYQIVSATQWLDGYVNDEMPLPLVDLRSYDEFNKIHLHNDAYDAAPLIVNLPLELLVSGERSCELPPRHVEFAILVPNNYADKFLASDKSQCSIHKLFFAAKSSATQQSRKPWLVRQVILESESLWKEDKILKFFKRNTDAAYGKHSDSGITHSQPLPRLWKPDPLVAYGILPLLKDCITNLCNKCKEAIDSSSGACCTHQYTVFDLGSGAGRDICYLAEETKAYYHTAILQQQHQQQQSMTQNKHFPLHFVGIDNHKGSAKRCIPLWKNRGVDHITSSHLLDLNKLNLVNDFFEGRNAIDQNESEKIKSTVVCLYAVRFLNRKLFSYIARSASDTEIETNPPSLCLPIGTIVAISHFCKPTQTSEWNFDHPKESNVLERTELSTLFSGAQWSVIKDDICCDGDHGRTLIQFIARKIT
jgi:hypothetical protein